MSDRNAMTATDAISQDLVTTRTLDELKAETQLRVDGNRYPLMGLKPEDVRETLTRIHSLNRNEWVAAWEVTGDRYLAKAEAAEKAGQAAEAKEAYKMAWHYFGFGRWPVEDTVARQNLAKRARATYMKFARYVDPPIELVRIPFRNTEIVALLQLPKGVARAPIMFKISGLDLRKEDGILEAEEFIRRGIGLFLVDMPGTGEAPVKVGLDAHQMLSAALDYLATRSDVDASRVVVHGRSWGAYWATLLAFVEAKRLRGSVAQGGAAHEYFQPEWLKKNVNTKEYLLDLLPARLFCYGFSSLDQVLDFVPKLSFKERGLIDQPNAPMLLVNGAKDSQVPIADLLLLLTTGTAKQAWVNPVGVHMGRSPEWHDTRIFSDVIVPWVCQQLHA